MNDGNLEHKDGIDGEFWFVNVDQHGIAYTFCADDTGPWIPWREVKAVQKYHGLSA